MDQTIENYHQLLWNKEAIKTFLEYSQSFWEYIDKKTITIDDNSYNEAFYGVHIKKDQKGCIN